MLVYEAACANGALLKVVWFTAAKIFSTMRSRSTSECDRSRWRTARGTRPRRMWLSEINPFLEVWEYRGRRSGVLRREGTRLRNFASCSDGGLLAGSPYGPVRRRRWRKAWTHPRSALWRRSRPNGFASRHPSDGRRGGIAGGRPCRHCRRRRGSPSDRLRGTRDVWPAQPRRWMADDGDRGPAAHTRHPRYGSYRTASGSAAARVGALVGVLLVVVVVGYLIFATSPGNPVQHALTFGQRLQPPGLGDSRRVLRAWRCPQGRVQRSSAND